MPDTARPEFPLKPAMAVAVIGLSVVSLLIAPCSHWELDEFLFRAGVESFEPLRHHPHPPGYPALIGLGKVMSAVAGDPFVGLRTLALISTLVGFLALAAAVATLTRSSSAGVVSSVLFWLSCAGLVHSTTPMSDPPALAFLFTGLWAWSRRWAGSASMWPAVVTGATLAMAIGCRPQYAVPIVPGLLLMLVMSRSRRFAALAIVAFVVVCLTWLVPLIVETGGIRGFLEYELGQAAYVAAHDAHLSRSWMSAGQILERFTEWPWGGGAMSTGIFVLALAGLVISIRQRLTGLAPLALVSSIHLAFTLATSDPADAVRYALVFQPFPAVLAAVALGRLDRFLRGGSLAVATLFAAASLVYAWPVLGPRARVASPPVRAAEWITSNVPADAVILYDNALRPHAELLLPDRRIAPVEDGVRELWDRSSAGVWLYADGHTASEGAMLFEWDGAARRVEPGDRSMDVRRSWSKVFGRLTRNHYGVVSVMPLPPDRRFLPGEGVYPIERSPRRPEWRWLAREAQLSIPPGSGSLEVTLHVPRDHPEETVDVTFLTEGRVLAKDVVRRDEWKAVTLPFPAAGGDLRIVSGSSHVPEQQGSRDPRELALQLLGLRRTPADAAL